MKSLAFALGALVVFLLGWLAGSISDSNQASQIEQAPDRLEGMLSLGNPAKEDMITKADDQAGQEDRAQTRDKPSPRGRIKNEQILVYDDEVVLKIKNPEWAIFADTKSMDPVIDSSSKAIEIVPESESELRVGDIVAYKSKYSDGIIIHRIVDIGNDDDGWYAILKGDNNEQQDPGKIRFEQIKRVVVAVIY